MPAHATARRRPWLRGWLGLLLVGLALAWMADTAAAEEPVRGEVRAIKEAGFTRLVFRLDETIDSNVRLSGAILVINFKKPVMVSVDRLSGQAPNDISAARSDPDGMAVRIALSHQVRINSIPAAERLYIDIMPANWAGPFPGLPQDVVDELATRARQAERELSRQRTTEKKRATPTIRVKVARLPTVTRYVLDVPKETEVSTARGDDKFEVRFDRQIKWDLADAIATMPPTLESIEAETEFNSVAVVFRFNGTPEVRSFREDTTVVVDVASGGMPAPKPAAEAARDQKAAASEKVPTIEPPQTVPVNDPPTMKDAPAPVLEPAAKPAAMMAPKEAQHDAPKAAAVTPPPAEPAPRMAAAPATQDARTETPKVSPMEAAKGAAKPAAMAADKPEPKPESEPGADSEAKHESKQDVKYGAVPENAMPMRGVPAAMLADAPVAKPEPITAEGTPPAPHSKATVAALVSQVGDNLRINFPFAMPTPAAAFLQADLIWLVFDNAAEIDLSAVARSFDPSVRRAWFERGREGEGIVRIRLARPRLASLQADGPGWMLTIGDTLKSPPIPLVVARSVIGQNGATISIPFKQAGKVHRLIDPAFGGRLMVITALAPSRGILKSQDFVELHVLPSAQGVAVQPVADDVTIKIDPTKIVIGRPSGLSLSSAVNGAQQQQIAPGFRALTFDTQVWGFDRKAPYGARQSELIRLAAAAPETKRREARFNLARFYLAREMGAEAIGVLNVATSDQRDSDDITGSILKAIANVMLGRPEVAIKELANPKIDNQPDAPIWRALAYARQGKWTEAHAAFKTTDKAIKALPIELQLMAMQEEMRANIEMRDYAGATRVANEFETMGVPAELEPMLSVLTGRLYQSLGRNTDALNNYRIAAAGTFDRPAAAQGRLREIDMLIKSGDIPHKEAIHQLETLTTVWRGDETETEGLSILAHLYTEDGRYRDAFHVMRTALLAHPNSDLTRKIQDEAAKTFDSLFLAGKGDALPPIEALGLFYDFRELTPIGRRGDEMIRRLADRLVSVDLLDQAAELLQHQVDHRLQGAARAQVATKLAMVYLMAHRPDQALSTLQKTRSSDLSNELRDQRLLLEARAMSDIGRRELALEVIAGIEGREADRLRADTLWAAKHYRRAAEQIEKMHGERWRQFTPLTEPERADILRAAIGYALSDEQIGLLRLREKYAAKMADGPDKRAFDVVTTPIGASGPEFQDVARKVAATDTLEGFLRDLRARYPDGSAPDKGAGKKERGKNEPAAGMPPVPAKPDVTSAAPQPEKAAMKMPAGASALPPKAPKGTPLTPDRNPTGSIRAVLPRPVLR